MTKIKRIVSFLPSATELIYEFEKEELLVGVTHECKFPKEVEKKLKIITSAIDSENLSSKEINHKTCQMLNDGKEIFILDETNLKIADPDLIISQETCEVCAAHSNQVKKALEVLSKKPQIYSMNPHNIEEILQSVTELGDILDEGEKAEKIRLDLKSRILKVKNLQHKEKPKVIALEWIEPFFTAGHWIPEMIEIAGGENLISKTGEHSKKINLENILEADPDIILLMPCGFNAERTIEEYNKFLKENSIWNQLRAVKNKRLFALDADSFFSKPSIRTIKGLEILCKIIEPEITKNFRAPENSYYNIIEGIKN